MIGDFVEQVEPDEQHEAGEHGRREQRHDVASDEQDHADDERDRDLR